MNFRVEVERLLDQIPQGHVARCGDVARALGDPRASIAVFRFLQGHPNVPGASRVVSGSGGPVANARFFTEFDSNAPLAKLRAEQASLSLKVSSQDSFDTVRTIAGVDVSYEGERGFATAVVLGASDLAVLEESRAMRVVAFPYIPTYLAEREFPLIEAALHNLTERPSVVLVDGHGRLHPRRCGLACSVGVKLDVPTIGVAKNPLSGTTWSRPEAGESEPVRIDGVIVGYATRVTSSTRTIFVSVGHRVSLQSALRIVKTSCAARNPEPLRLAHVRATEFKRRKVKKDSKMV